MPDQLKDSAGYNQLFAHLAGGKRRRGGAKAGAANYSPSKVVDAVPTGSPAGKEAREAALHTHVTGIICGVGEEVYPGRCIRAAKKIVALVRAHDRQENIRSQTHPAEPDKAL